MSIKLAIILIIETMIITIIREQIKDIRYLNQFIIFKINTIFIIALPPIKKKPTYYLSKMNTQIKTTATIKSEIPKINRKLRKNLKCFIITHNNHMQLLITPNMKNNKIYITRPNLLKTRVVLITIKT